MRYIGNDNNGNPKSDYIDRIGTMLDQELYDETRKIWLAGSLANTDPHSDYDWKRLACYDEWLNRDKDYEYARAWREALRAKNKIEISKLP